MKVAVMIDEVRFGGPEKIAADFIMLAKSAKREAKTTIEGAQPGSIFFVGVCPG
jgi:hypothetical protein